MGYGLQNWISDHFGYIRFATTGIRNKYLKIGVDKAGKIHCASVRDMGMWLGIKPSEVDYKEWLTWAARSQMGLAAFQGTFIVGSCFESGIKAYCPTAQEYDTLSEIDINVTVADYRQPFDTFTVVIPEERRVFIDDDVGHAVIVTGWHSQELGLILIALQGTGTSELVFSMLTNGRQDDTIEAAIKRLAPSELNEKDSESLATARRVYMNACLLMTNFGMKRIGRPDERAYADAERISRNKNVTAEWREHNRLKAALMPEVFTIDQHIDLREATEVPREHRDSLPTGTMPPHWRRAHWAMQAHGPNHSLRKMVFRKAAFVNRHRFGGDGLDSTTTYQ